ncbi:hypothetical protein BB347_17710 (plasmid) [Natronorubrum daqingense]|uniref:Uncharacterized protein n=1 Tax=Natronorubrum daqingense TaxID=588898 RepID=A0A1P8RIS1_9EURY|nr:hypothetical protein BB347_17710 [Natronorubrum daqingense]
MMIGRDERKRDRSGKFSKYDSDKQADRGHRAHENWIQTQFRRLRWRLGGLIPGRSRSKRGPRK